MKLLFNCVLISIVFGMGAVLAAPIKPTEIDPYRVETMVKSGKYRGYVVRTDERRSIRLLTPREAYQLTGMDGGYAFANFSHEGKFCLAWIDADAVEDVIFQLEYFSMVGHTQLRFKLKRGYPVRLFRQPGNEAPEQTLLTDVIFSAEAVPLEKGPVYNVLNGFTPAFGLALRMVSLEDKYQYMIGNQKHRVRQFRLNLDANQKRQLLRNALRRSHVAGMDRMYNTGYRSCVTEVFDLLGRTAGKSLMSHMTYPLDRIPNTVYWNLRLKGLLDRTYHGEYPDLDEEWAVREAVSANASSCETELGNAGA